MTPNWFASVMGTGIIAVVASAAAESSAVHNTGVHSILHAVAVTFWVIATLLLLVLTASYARRWLRYPQAARGDLRDPLMFPFTGAIAMAILTVGAASGSAGRGILGDTVATDVQALLWAIGTVIGIATYTAMLRRVLSAKGYPSPPVPAWLMPVVPPMVSAATGAILAAELGGGIATALTVFGYIQFGAALIGVVIVGLPLARQLRAEGIPWGPVVPTLWIPLGVVGQSVAAANLLGHGTWARAFGVGYGFVFGTIGLVAFAAMGATTGVAVRRRLPFAPSWWSFTFPIGTCASGAIALSEAANKTTIYLAGIVLLVILGGAWMVVTAATVAALLRARAGRRELVRRLASEPRVQTVAGAPDSTERPDCIHAVVPPATETALMSRA
ncbi:MAG: C4-dicarboxylate ABC transporter [Rhodococcus sp.]|nr:C4-dicarboxylate ABC transporter [Rhodococcus sp. (in: high G+C Gram-positive bacteria)]